jgi:hypothetical protein
MIDFNSKGKCVGKNNIKVFKYKPPLPIVRPYVKHLKLVSPLYFDSTDMLGVFIGV